MLQTLRSLGVLRFIPKGFKVRQRIAPQTEGSQSASVDDEGRARLEQDEAAIQRLMSRVELELSDREAVQRRETIARLKGAAAFSGQEALSGDLAPSEPPGP
jgi:hypothetical protein